MYARRRKEKQGGWCTEERRRRRRRRPTGGGGFQEGHLPSTAERDRVGVKLGSLIDNYKEGRVAPCQ